ncbi:hypothetical protein [Cupriavidus taiwanensis]|uniref:hypothetical protein n=1 Tax=Cupriavidus taiwanensis TaxID=164546 RepID=UPI000425FA3F|nr:hypothetical protein [Cupriavidus taiwanensis]SOZ12084.1 Phage tail protein [Cupriavidus taiwanensis]
MALEEYVGAVVLEVDAREVDVVEYSVTSRTGTKPVKTMNRNGRVKGFAKGIEEHELAVTVVIPKSGDLDWMAIAGAKLTDHPVSPGGQRVSYLDCYTTEVGEKYSADNEARRDIKLFASRRVVE